MGYDKTKHKKDDFGNRMKAYEARATQERLMPDSAVVARIDGRAFHGFCKRNFKPGYDQDFNDAMLATTEWLVKGTNALIGYTQSDEITLVWYHDYRKPMLFDGKVFKLTSVLASIATAAFNNMLPDSIRRKELATFDCRIYNVPDKEEACNALLWREKDATRNSIFSLANTFYTHKELDGKSSSDLQEMVFQKGVNWNDCPPHQKRGTYIRMETVEKTLTDFERLSTPMKHAARSNPDLVVKRRVMKYVKMPPFSKVFDRVGVLFEGKHPFVDHDYEASNCICEDCKCDK